MFSARLRLPSSMTIEEKRKRTEFLIEMLGLKECADTYVGDEKVNTHTVLNYESQLKWPIPKKKKLSVLGGSQKIHINLDSWLYFG